MFLYNWNDNGIKSIDEVENLDFFLVRLESIFPSEFSLGFSSFFF